MRHQHTTFLIIAGAMCTPLHASESCFAPRGVDGLVEMPSPFLLRGETAEPAAKPEDTAWKSTAPEPAEAGATVIEADAMVLERETDTVTFDGEVHVLNDDRHLRADQVRFDRKTDELDATGSTIIEQPGLRLEGAKAHMSTRANTGNIDSLHYFLTERNGRGSAEKAFIESADLSRYEGITYTTCEPGSDDWILSADEMKISQDTGIGVANNVTLMFKDVPLLYTPYLNFPIDERRKSGLLAPVFANSDETGIDITIPYYINIAPNLDATLSPRILTKRGLLVGGEFRYLSERFLGQVRGELIPSDDEYAEDPGAWRGALTWQHSVRLAPRWSTNLLYNFASDSDYLEDFGTNLGITSTRNLERRADLNYRGQDWKLLARVQGFQTVDAGIPPALRPYDRLPQLLLRRNRRERSYELNWDMETEYVFFDHVVNEYGHRLALEPWISYPMRTIYGHLIPKAKLYHTRYELSRRDDGLPDSMQITLPSFSLDSGLIFERDLNWFGHDSTQTLEPRAYYLYTPNKDQDDFPDFDTEELDFSYANLFRDNRFTGRDRIGDANQLTLGLTSRTLSNETGRTLFQASVGQTLYFRDREVQLAGEDDQRSSSSYAAEVAARLTDNWQTRAGMQWDPHLPSGNVEKSTFELHYQTPEDKILNLAYRFRRDDVEDADLSFRWPFSKKLQAVGRINYSMRHRQTMESFAGLEYRRCCWLVRAVTRHWVNEPNGKANTAVMLQLELNGLGSLGERVDQFLERGIYGYQID